MAAAGRSRAGLGESSPGVGARCCPAGRRRSGRGWEYRPAPIGLGQESVQDRYRSAPCRCSTSRSPDRRAQAPPAADPLIRWRTPSGDMECRGELGPRSSSGIGLFRPAAGLWAGVPSHNLPLKKIRAGLDPLIHSIGSWKPRVPVMNCPEDSGPGQELFEPRSLEWQENGELASAEMFELVKRLRAVESGKTVNELWRLSQKA